MGWIAKAFPKPSEIDDDTIGAVADNQIPGSTAVLRISTEVEASRVTSSFQATLKIRSQSHSGCKATQRININTTFSTIKMNNIFGCI